MRMEILTTKQQVIDAFGSSSIAAGYIGITKQYFSFWPEELPTKLSFWATGALIAKQQGIKPSKAICIGNSPKSPRKRANTTNRIQHWVNKQVKTHGTDSHYPIMEGTQG